MAMLEFVRGTVIGEFTHVYQFFTRDGAQLTDKRLFASDDEAVAWLKINYPLEYASGAEMRTWE